MTGSSRYHSAGTRVLLATVEDEMPKPPESHEPPKPPDAAPPRSTPRSAVAEAQVRKKERELFAKLRRVKRFPMDRDKEPGAER